MRPIRSLVLLCGLGLPVQASPFSDLASPSPEVRAQAAKAIRDGHLYRPTARAPWDKLAAGLGNGRPAEDVVDYLHRKGLMVDSPADDLSRNGENEFRLDDSWVLECDINDSVVTNVAVVHEPRKVVVTPPADYTGYWRTYRVDGKSTGLIFYTHGIYCGTPADSPPEVEEMTLPREFYEPSDTTTPKKSVPPTP